MIGKELTDKALNQINTVKQDSYEKPEDSFGSIARRWTEYLHNKYGTGKSVTGRTVSALELTPQDVAFMIMELIEYTCLMEDME